MRNHRRTLALLLCAVMLFGTLSITASAAEANSLANFTKENTYENGIFPDVVNSEWYFENVKTAYELGLMIGQGDRFGTGSDITIGETVTLAARIHSIYAGDKADFTQGTPWYQVYVDYMTGNKLTDLEGMDMTAKATRAQFAYILSTALPEEALKQVNNIADGAIPDVKDGDPCATAIYELYRAGILNGVDSEGTFSPNATIIRAEVAAIVTRMADETLRVEIALGEFFTVTFDPNYSGAQSQKVSVEAGKSVARPTAPTRSGYVFTGWYTAATKGTTYNFNDKVNADLTLYAHWRTSSSGGGGSSSGGGGSSSGGGGSSSGGGGSSSTDTGKGSALNSNAKPVKKTFKVDETTEMTEVDKQYYVIISDGVTGSTIATDQVEPSLASLAVNGATFSANGNPGWIKVARDGTISGTRPNAAADASEFTVTISASGYTSAKVLVYVGAVIDVTKAGETAKTEVAQEAAKMQTALKDALEDSDSEAVSNVAVSSSEVSVEEEGGKVIQSSTITVNVTTDPEKSDKEKVSAFAETMSATVAEQLAEKIAELNITSLGDTEIMDGMDLEAQIVSYAKEVYQSQLNEIAKETGTALRDLTLEDLQNSSKKLDGTFELISAGGTVYEYTIDISTLAA